jgi:hypothetical protein
MKKLILILILMLLISFNLLAKVQVAVIGATTDSASLTRSINNYIDYTLRVNPKGKIIDIKYVMNGDGAYAHEPQYSAMIIYDDGKE